MKKKLILFCLILMSFAMIAGCSDSDDGGDDDWSIDDAKTDMDISWAPKFITLRTPIEDVSGIDMQGEHRDVTYSGTNSPELNAYIALLMADGYTYYAGTKLGDLGAYVKGSQSVGIYKNGTNDDVIVYREVDNRYKGKIIPTKIVISPGVAAYSQTYTFTYTPVGSNSSCSGGTTSVNLSLNPLGLEGGDASWTGTITITGGTGSSSYLYMNCRGILVPVTQQ